MRQFFKGMSLLFILLILVTAGVRCRRPAVEVKEQDLLRIVHERPLLAGRIIRSVLEETHGTEILKKQLKTDPRSARTLVDMMLADRELGPMVRERCRAHLTSNERHSEGAK